MSGLIWVWQGALVDKNRVLSLGDSSSFLEIGIRDGQWSPFFDIVTTRDFPTSDCRWLKINNEETLIKIDFKGNKHVLLRSVFPGFWSSHDEMNYLVEDGGTWSAPLTLDHSCHLKQGCSLALGESGAGFATWVNGKKNLVGRWIRPSVGEHE